ncbi:MAG: YqgE/AlgH family protein [Bacteroidota bacterium]
MGKLEAGCLLIAEPFLGDPNFERSVILLCENNSDGSFGLVLNQPTEYNLGDLLSKNVYPDIKVNVGGPVQRDTLHFLHTNPAAITEGIEIVKGLYWGGNFDKMLENLNLGIISIDQVRFFIGYSGWSAGQLDQEMKRNSWIISEGDSESIMKTSKEYWRDTLKKMGGDFKVMANYPIDPRLN